MDVATHQIKVHMCMTKASLDVLDCWEIRTERGEKLEVVINERRRNSRSMYANNFVYSGLLVKHGRGWRTRDQS